jgi:hypothetical protein
MPINLADNCQPAAAGRNAQETAGACQFKIRSMIMQTSQNVQGPGPVVRFAFNPSHRVRKPLWAAKPHISTKAKAPKHRQDYADTHHTCAPYLTRTDRSARILLKRKRSTRLLVQKFGAAPSMRCYGVASPYSNLIFPEFSIASIAIAEVSWTGGPVLIPRVFLQLRGAHFAKNRESMAGGKTKSPLPSCLQLFA